MKETDAKMRRVVGGASLRELLDVGVVQKLLDWFSEVTKISAIVRDLDGNPLTRPSYQNPFCRLVMGTPEGERCCRASNRRAVKRAARDRRVVKYVCHAGLSQLAAPIEVDGVRIGTIVMGDRPEGRVSARKIAAVSHKIGVPAERLKKALEEVRPWSDEEMRHAAERLISVANAVAALCCQGAQLRARLHEISSLYELSRLLAGTLDLDRVLHLVARSATELLGAKGCSIRLLDTRRRQLVVKTYYKLSRRYMNKGPVLLDKSRIDREVLARPPSRSRRTNADASHGVVQIPDMLNDPRVLYPKEAAEEGIRSGICVGLFSRGKPVGTLHLYTAEPRRFNEDEVRLLQSLASHAALAIDNARLYEESVEKRRLDRELRVAARMQEHLIPERPPEIEGFDIAAINIPCTEVGGDFYDFVPLRGHKRAFIIADVAGKGIPAALLMASARAALRAHLESTSRPAEAARRLNLNICHDARSGEFVSLFMGVLDPKRRLMRYTNAGHNPPLLIRRAGRRRRPRILPLEKGGMVLGALDEEKYEEAEITLRSGDLVVLFTDGVTEALDAEGNVFGVERLASVVTAAYDLSAAGVLACIRDAVEAHAKGTPRSDDMTLIVLRVL